jgi:hypothetical protein
LLRTPRGPGGHAAVFVPVQALDDAEWFAAHFFQVVLGTRTTEI